VRGNVAAKWFTDEVNGGLDYVTKVELLAVNRPKFARPYFWSGQIPDVRECLLDVSAAVEELHRSLPVLSAWATKS
jgi:hypothetical protein